jgi:hypothetical protein
MIDGSACAAPLCCTIFSYETIMVGLSAAAEAIAALRTDNLEVAQLIFIAGGDVEENGGYPKAKLGSGSLVLSCLPPLLG